MLKKFLLFLTFFCLFFYLPLITFAESGSAKLNTQVKRVSHPQERLWEKIQLFFTFSQNQKITLHQKIVEKRLSEVSFVVMSRQHDLLEATSSRYMTYLGSFRDYLKNKRQIDPKEEIKQFLKRHLTILLKLQSSYPDPSVFRMLLQHDINTIQNFLKDLSAID